MNVQEAFENIKMCVESCGTHLDIDSLEFIRKELFGESRQQHTTQAKAAEALPEGEICPCCKQNRVPMQLSDFMGFGQDILE